MRVVASCLVISILVLLLILALLLGWKIFLHLDYWLFLRGKRLLHSRRSRALRIDVSPPVGPARPPAWNGSSVANGRPPPSSFPEWAALHFWGPERSHDKTVLRDIMEVGSAVLRDPLKSIDGRRNVRHAATTPAALA